MKKLVVCVVGLIVLAGVHTVHAQQYSVGQFDIEVYPTKTVLLHDTKNDFVLIKPAKHKLTFSTQGTTATALRDIQQANITINAGYFGYVDDTTKAEFVPAGSYPYSVETIANDLPCARDKNLCGRIDAQTLQIQNSVRLVDRTVLNAGPMLVDHGILNTEVLQNHSHWTRSTQRTVLINSDKFGKLFLISTKPRTLLDVAMLAQGLGTKVTAINLDGGSSTAYSSRYSKYNATKRLPTFFVIN